MLERCVAAEGSKVIAGVLPRDAHLARPILAGDAHRISKARDFSVHTRLDDVRVLHGFRQHAVRSRQAPRIVSVSVADATFSTEGVSVGRRYPLWWYWGSLLVRSDSSPMLPFQR
jgi:hypothetical protein